MSKILNASAVHNNGIAEVQVGLNNDKFTIKRNADNTIGFVDIEGKDLKPDGVAEAVHIHSTSEISNFPTIPSGVSAVEHQYAISNSKENISNVETWVTASTPLSQRIRACIFANGYYVVCGTAGELAYSEDGNTWTTVTPFVSGTLTNISYGKGKFIIVDEFANLWMAEETPKSWSKIRNGDEWVNGIGSLTYANNQFIVAGDYMAAFSDDAYSWTQVEAPGEYNQVTFGNGRYVAVGANGAIGVSYDGKNWVDKSNPEVTGDLRAVTYAKGQFIIGGIDGVIMYTQDFITWKISTTNSAGVRYIRQIVYAENKYYAACYTSSGTGEIWTSNDGATWTVQQQMPTRLWCLNYNDGRMIAAGDNGSIYTLDLGIVWLPKQPELVDGQYLWERIAFTLSDGGSVVSDGVFIKSSTPDVSGQITDHNVAADAHNDIRLLVSELSTKVNHFLDVDDATADELSEVLTLIENNKGTLESLTTSKVNVSDIINDLVTNVGNKPLSAAQGVALKALIDAIPSWAKASTKPTYTAAEVGASATGHKHSKSEITDFPTSMTPTAHNQAASTITAGTFAGQVVANASGQTPSVSLVRNSKVVLTEEYPTVEGEIVWVCK